MIIMVEPKENFLHFAALNDSNNYCLIITVTVFIAVFSEPRSFNSIVFK